MKYLYIEYADPQTHQNSFSVRFRILENEVAELWTQALLAAQQQYQIDNPYRFYGLNSSEYETNSVIQKINECVDVINSHGHIINRKLTCIDDQDTLNHLHHVFEVYHGLMGKQTHRFYLTANLNVRKALSDLNILVHSCESVQRQHPPNHTVTYFGSQRDYQFKPEHYHLFTNEHQFGTVLVNYTEIGKTLANLMDDQDEYISDEAFKPYKHYSADFNVRYFSTDPLVIKERNAKIQAYYDSKKDYFGPWQDCFVDGSVPVAIIDQDLDLQNIAVRQFVKSVTIKEKHA